MIEVAHFFSNYRGIGGVESMLRQHHARDSDWGMNSRFVILREAPQPPVERVCFLGLKQWSTIAGLRERLQGLRLPQDLVDIYHTLGPMRAFVCPYDAAARRVLVLHGKGDRLREDLAARRTWIDAVVCVNEQSKELAREYLPQLAPDRFMTVPVPVIPCAVVSQQRPLKGRPIVLGYSGRLWRQHKRVDRLPALCRQLARLGVDYRLEILGEGPEQTWLKQQFAGNDRVQLLGSWSGEKYLERIATWDVILFVSDTEGQPVSLIEAMSGGVLPVFPGIGSGGDAYAVAVDPSLLYPPGATEQAAQIILRLSRGEPGEILRLRARSMLAVKANLDGTYFAKIAGLVREVIESKRVSTDEFPRWPRPLNYVPLGLIIRVALLWRRIVQP